LGGGGCQPFFTGFILTSYIIRKLGDERYGIWALTFSLIEYVFLFDLGFRSALVTFVSRRRTQGDTGGINALLSTALAYFGVVAVVVAALTCLLSTQAANWFHVQEQYRADFAFLLTLVGLTWAVGILASVFQASLEASQTFQTYSHIMVIVLLLRSGGSAALLYFGFGLHEMGLMVVGSQCLGYGLMFLAFWRAYPEVKISWGSVGMATWKEMAGFGVSSLTVASGSLFLNQGPPVLIGRYLTEAYVGYYTVPARMLQHIVDMVTRIGCVTVPKTAELLALGQRDKIVQLGVYINRYALALFMPITIYLMFYGTTLVGIWLGKSFAQQSGALIPVLVGAMAFAVAGQFNSSMILVGMGVHRLYSRSIVGEALLLVAGMFLVLPRYGLFGAACLASALMVINRGLCTPMMVCYHLKVNYFTYMASIYVRPLATAVPVAATVWWLKQGHWVTGRNWFELIGVGGALAAAYLALCFVTVLDPQHRASFWTLLRARLPRQWVSAS